MRSEDPDLENLVRPSQWEPSSWFFDVWTLSELRILAPFALLVGLVSLAKAYHPGEVVLDVEAQYA